MDPLRFATFFLRGKLTVTTQTNYINDNKQKPTIFTKDVTHLQSKKWSNGSGVFVSHKSPGFMCDRGSLGVFYLRSGRRSPTSNLLKKILRKIHRDPKKLTFFSRQNCQESRNSFQPALVNQLLNFESMSPPRCFSIGEIDATASSAWDLSKNPQAIHAF